MLDCRPLDRESRPVGDRIEAQAQLSGHLTEAERPRAICSDHGDATFCVQGPDSSTPHIDRLEIDRFMTASSVFRLVHTCLTAGAVAGLLPVRAGQAGVCPVALRTAATSANGTSEAGDFERHPLMSTDVQVQAKLRPWFARQYSEPSIATSKRGLESQITKTECSAQTDMEGPRPTV